MQKIATLILVLAAAAVCSCNVDPASIRAADRIVLCGVLIDGLSAEPRLNQVIVVDDNRIREVRTFNNDTDIGNKVLDLSEHTCLPGLIDTHVHLDVRPEDSDDYTIYLRRTPAETQTMSEEHAAIVLRAGFTTVRHTGSYLAWIDRDVRDRINSGAVIGPRIQVGGPYLTIPHGGGDMYIPGVADEQVPDYYRMGVARGADAFRQRAEQSVAGGADFIKIIASGAVFGYGGIPGAPEMTPQEIAAVVGVAKAAGIKVTAHAHGAQSIKDAILAGVDSIEHASLGDDESVALALQHDVAFSMDVYNGTYTEEVGVAQGYADEFMRKNEETTDAQRVVFKKAVDAGVRLTFGTDLGVLPHHLGAHQFTAMVEHGMTPMQAIKAASSVAAYEMGWSGDVGAIASGRYADIIAVQCDPLKHIECLRNIDVVIKGGVVIQ